MNGERTSESGEAREKKALTSLAPERAAVISEPFPIKHGPIMLTESFVS